MKRLIFVLLIVVSSCSDSKESLDRTEVSTTDLRESESKPTEADFADTLKRNGVETTIVPTKIESLKLQSDDPYAENTISGGFFVSGRTVWLLPNDESYGSGFARIDLRDGTYTKYSGGFVGVVGGAVFFRQKGSAYSKISPDFVLQDTDSFLGGNATLQALDYKPVRTVFPFGSATTLVTTWIDADDMSHISTLSSATKWPPSDLSRGQVFNWSLDGKYVLIHSSGEKAKVFEVGIPEPLLECGEGAYFISTRLLCLESYSLNPLHDESQFDISGDYYIMKVIDLVSRKETRLALKCRLYNATFVLVSPQELLAIDSGTSSLISDIDSDKYYVFALPKNEVF